MQKTPEEIRHDDLLRLGFTIDDSHTIKVYNHSCGIWIADFALVQYNQSEWAEFLDEVNKELLR